MDITKLIAVIRSASTIEAARAVYDLVVSVADTLGQDDQLKLQAALPELLARMNTHVDEAVGDLRG